MAYRKAATIFKSVIGQAKQVGRAWLRYWAEAELSRVLIHSGQIDEIDLDWITKDLETTGSALPAEKPNLLGELALLEGRLPEALKLAEEACELAKGRGWNPSCGRALELQSRVLLKMERPGDAIVLIDQGLSIADKMDSNPLKWRFQLAYARALALLGDETAAAEAYRCAADTVRQLADTISDTRLQREYLSGSSVLSVLQHG